MRKNIVLEKTIDLSVQIINFCEMLEKERKYVVSNQLLKSGTSIGANVFEAQNAESKNDFIHKIKIAAKELEETKYWLTLCKLVYTYPYDEKIQKDVDEIGLILYKIISSSKKNQFTH